MATQLAQRRFELAFVIASCAWMRARLASAAGRPEKEVLPLGWVGHLHSALFSIATEQISGVFGSEESALETG